MGKAFDLHSLFIGVSHVSFSLAQKKELWSGRRIQRRRDISGSTYERKGCHGPLVRYVTAMPCKNLRSHAPVISAVCQHILHHRFDLLGSGWVQVKHGTKCLGLEEYHYQPGSPLEADPKGLWLEGRIRSSNLRESQRIWRLLVQHMRVKYGNKEDYVPIDWQLDFKSGYRWSERTWYKDIQYGNTLGPDVKVPRELGRMQHVPQLALAYGMAKYGYKQFLPKETYLAEFCCQLLDFIATNPPRFGVNWQCTMDIGIRITSWLIAHDLFESFGAKFEKEFERIFIRSIYEHGKHIIGNLEWSLRLRHNHYLANIVGLLFVSAYLGRSPEIDAWLGFSVQELIKEAETQFHPDGSNFEASTCYHRLSAEMVAYATALVLGLSENKRQALYDYDHKIISCRPKLKKAPLPFYLLPTNGRETAVTSKNGCSTTSPLPLWFFQRLERMAEFTMHVTKPNGHVVQIGDNDSGRFLKLVPPYRRMTVAKAKKRFLNLKHYNGLPETEIYYLEDTLDHRHLVAAISGIINRDDFNSFNDNEPLDKMMVSKLTKGVLLKTGGSPIASEKFAIGTTQEEEKLLEKLNKLPEESRHIYTIPMSAKRSLTELKHYAYPDFGIYIFRSETAFLSIRCGPIGRQDRGGHAHNDQLAIELHVAGRDWIVDLGTYLYTPLPHRRNEYRSVRAHFAPRVEDREPGHVGRSLFVLGNEANSRVLYFGRGGFIGMHVGFGFPIYRVIEFVKENIVVKDYFDSKRKKVATNPIIQKLRIPALRESPGYGILEGRPRINPFSERPFHTQKNNTAS